MWVKTKALFLNDSELYEILGKEGEPEWNDYYFRLDRLESFNRATEGMGTCIRLMSGFDINVKIKFEDLETSVKKFLGSRHV